jgi:flavodoxin
MTGNTKDLALKMKKVLEKYNHEVEIYRDSALKRKISDQKNFFDPYDLMCLGSCTHAFAPAVSFSSFLNIMKKHDLGNKKLACFATSATSAWEGTCKNIQKRFPNLQHIGNFGCSVRSNQRTLRNFDECIRNLKKKR